MDKQIQHTRNKKAPNKKAEGRGHDQEQEHHYNHALPIPADKVGWILGKGGSYITQLCEKSGANVVISDSESHEFGRKWKYIAIRGTGRQMDRAKKLIYIRLERYESTTQQGNQPEKVDGREEDENGSPAKMASKTFEQQSRANPPPAPANVNRNSMKTDGTLPAASVKEDAMSMPDP